MSSAADFAAVAITLYVAHHVGDYWVQTDWQARHKGLRGQEGRVACLLHVLSYLMTQTAGLFVITLALHVWLSTAGILIALAVSGVTHYMADRREYGLMVKLARRLPGKQAFLRLGMPRDARMIEAQFDCTRCAGTGRVASDESTSGLCWDCRGGGKLPSALTIDDNPQLATGAWALDQAWHIFFGVFMAALLAVTL